MRWLARLLLGHVVARRKPTIVGTGARAVATKVHSYEAKVIVGEETARKLTSILGREVGVGEEFDLGTIAHESDQSLVKPHVFSDPRLAN